ncbi:MAG: sugar-binding protein [Paludibacter sp.]
MKKFSSLIAIAIIAAAPALKAAQPTIPLLIAPTTTAPTIDGSDADATWAGITAQPVNVIFKGETAGFDADGSGDLDATLKVTFDKDKLYFLVKVLDDVVTTDPALHWVGDKVELYFGLAGYKPTDSAHGLYTRQFDFAASTDPNQLHGLLSYIGSGAAATDGIENAFAEIDGGYIIEVSLDRTIALNSVPDMAEIAFDLGISDNDVVGGAGVRYRKSWYNDGAVNELWANMTGAGKVKLNGNTGYVGSAGINDVKADLDFGISNNTITLKSIENANITLFDIVGKKLSTFKNTNNLSIENLKSGVYFATVQNSNGIMLGKIRFVK